MCNIIACCSHSSRTCHLPKQASKLTLTLYDSHLPDVGLSACAGYNIHANPISPLSVFVPHASILCCVHTAYAGVRAVPSLCYLFHCLFCFCKRVSCADCMWARAGVRGGPSLCDMYTCATRLIPRQGNSNKDAFLQLWLGCARLQWCALLSELEMSLTFWLRSGLLT